jgi:hypothetical protein
MMTGPNSIGQIGYREMANEAGTARAVDQSSACTQNPGVILDGSDQ